MAGGGTAALELVLLSAPLSAGPTRLFLMAALAGHGASDLALRGRRPYQTYAVVYIAFGILPEILVNVIFVALSVVHFAEDIGPVGSAALHAAVGATSMTLSRETGIDVVLLYSAFFHVPMHFIQLSDNGETMGIAAALVFMFLFGIGAILWPEAYLLASDGGDDEISISVSIQCVVAAHIVFSQQKGNLAH